MNIIIYNINSLGGNYEYVKCIFQAYQNNKDINRCIMLMPANANIKGNDIYPILLSDISGFNCKLIRKAYFLYRSFINPFRLYRYLQKQSSAIVLFNDFDQITALFWPWFFSSLKKKHLFAVILHDPDRDNFFSLKVLCQQTMRNIMSVIDIAFYHGFLPQKKYYEGSFLKVSVPHGIYFSEEKDSRLANFLEKQKGTNVLVGILGNIRAEKNYELVIDSLQQLKNFKLLIAGKAANSNVSVHCYQQYAINKGVSEKIIWLTDYLTQAAFNTAIQSCDVILLYYKSSFISQSGVLNSIAPFMKKLIVSDTNSSLAHTVKKYRLGMLVPQNNANQLAIAIAEISKSDKADCCANWHHYMKEVSWERHVQIAVNAYKKILHER